MKTKSSPSLYRYCMSRLSTLAVSTLVPALNVLSTTLPESTALSLVRTNAGPLPGFTCWNSTTDQSWPSMFSTMPFFRSFVVATASLFLAARRCPLPQVYRAVPDRPIGRSRSRVAQARWRPVEGARRRTHRASTTWGAPSEKQPTPDASRRAGRRRRGGPARPGAVRAGCRVGGDPAGPDVAVPELCEPGTEEPGAQLGPG